MIIPSTYVQITDVPSRTLLERVDDIAGRPITQALRADIDAMIAEIERDICLCQGRVSEVQAVALVKLHQYRRYCGCVSPD